MDVLLASLVDGLLIGFVYGLAAMGLTLIFGVMDVVNLSHGALIALGMFGVYLLFTGLGLNPYLGLLIVLVLGIILGMILYAIAIHPLLDGPHLSTLLSTFAVSMIIIGVGTMLFTSTPRNIDINLGSMVLGPVRLQGTRVVAALVAILVATGLYIFMYRTHVGKSIRAVANNRDAAELVGIPSVRILAFSFGLGTMLAMVSGGLIATLFPFSILSGGTYELKSFVICVLGGLGNPTGALLGGLILGLIEGLIPVFMPVGWTPVIEFTLFVLIILIRPSGILGAR
ncbi:MAG: branched-chain amino acid ABC transporter permease [Chloroflexi bacterium]|nr:branched-chain amino acid ABC transporter permease [Chloroflexota bacterium]